MKKTYYKAVIERTVFQFRKISDAIRIILPKSLLTRLNLKESGQLDVVETNGMKLNSNDPKRAEAMAIARRAFRTYAKTFKALAQ